MNDVRPLPDEGELPAELARLADWALQDLDAGDDLDPAERAAWERAAALGAIAGLPRETMPESLRLQVLEQARPFVRTVAAAAPAPFPAAWTTWLGWAVAAAVAVAWLMPSTGVRTVADARSKLLAEAPDAKVVPWAPSEHPDAKGAAGDVVWSDARQEGYLRFRGLRGHDPQRAQYQLWIFDPARDQRFPVDGGVFDIPPGAEEVVVPIKPAVRVAGPTLFAVTRERPGGVVVSDRSQLALAAPVK